jgi:hypothetical protein
MEAMTAGDPEPHLARRHQDHGQHGEDGQGGERCHDGLVRLEAQAFEELPFLELAVGHKASPEGDGADDSGNTGGDERLKFGGIARVKGGAGHESDAPPPKPFRRATICGMPVMGVDLASQAPIAVPSSRALATRVTLRLLVCRTVMTMASSMPQALIALPRDAVRGEDMSLKARMKQTAPMR